MRYILISLFLFAPASAFSEKNFLTREVDENYQTCTKAIENGVVLNVLERVGDFDLGTRIIYYKDRLYTISVGTSWMKCSAREFL
jgi:hypothetical protein